jgi:hypothetical protein
MTITIIPASSNNGLIYIDTLGVGDVVSTAISAQYALSQQTTRIAAEAILIGEPVYSHSDTQCGVGTNNDTKGKATILGIALNGGAIGDTINILVSGPMTNSLFSAFALNTLLFLDIDGGITDVRPTKPTAHYLAPIAKAEGNNTIFIQIGNITQLS